jgi:hypothetical protein
MVAFLHTHIEKKDADEQEDRKRKEELRLTLVVLEAAFLRSRNKVREVRTVKLDLRNRFHIVLGESLAVNGDQSTFGIRKRHDVSAELENLEGRILGDVSGPGNEHLGVFERGWGGRFCEHVLDVVDKAVAGGFRTDEGAAPVAAFAGEDAGELVADLLVCAKQIGDFTSTDTNVTCWDVGVASDVSA